MAVVADPADVAKVAVAAFPPMFNVVAVPVKPVPGPLNCVEAVIVVPPMVVKTPVEAVEAPIVVPLILPPVIATELAF